MNKRLLLSWFFLLLFLHGGIEAGTVPDEVIEAIASVETHNGEDKRDGDNGKSIGVFQIQCGYVQDANQWAGTSFRWEEVRDRDKAEFIVRSYLDRWGENYRRTMGRDPSFEVLVRIHNGGPNGWRQQSSLKYWRKIQDEDAYRRYMLRHALGAVLGLWM